MLKTKALIRFTFLGAVIAWLVLVFSNASDMEFLFPYRQTFGQRCDIPQGLSSLAYNVLTATLVYLEFQEDLRWSLVNYQYR